MSFSSALRDFGGFACNCFFFMGNVISDTALSVAEHIQQISGIEAVPGIRRQRIDIKKGVQELNSELLELRRKYFHDEKKLSSRDRDRYNELLEKRSRKKDQLWNLNEAENAEKARNNPEAVTGTVITPNKPHISQYHIGQIAKNKNCPTCNYPMVLNFRRGAEAANTSDLFWTCSYNNFLGRGEWHPTQPFQHSDYNVFTNDKIGEFECSNDELTTIFRAEQRDVIIRLEQHLSNEKINSYICPIHGEDLVLRKKNNAASLGALEKYFLGCPRFNKNDPHGPDSCRFKITLKSPAQLTAVLHGYEGRGMFKS